MSTDEELDEELQELEDRYNNARDAARQPMLKRVRYRCDECRRVVSMNKLDSALYFNAPNAIGGGDKSGPYGPEGCTACCKYTIDEIREIYRERIENGRGCDY